MSRDWYAVGIACGAFECRWVATDSKHIEVFWGDVSRYEVFVGVWEKEKGESDYKRVVDTPDQLIQQLMEMAQFERQDWKDEVVVIPPDGLVEFPLVKPDFKELEKTLKFQVVEKNE